MRTDEQKRAFAKECLEIEKSGGDVLAHIALEWPSYTPRATWYNLQKQYLNRTTANLTEGKPKIPKDNGKEVKDMSRMMELAKGAVDAYENGESVYAYLKNNGSKNPSAYWYQLKVTVRDKDPELYEKMSKIRTDSRKKLEPEEIKTVFFGGKTYEKAEKPEQNAPKTERTTGDHVSAKEYRETLKITPKAPEGEARMAILDEIDAWKNPLPVCAVKSRIKGEWHLSQVKGCVHLIWEDCMTHEERSLGLPAEDWLKLADEIPQMIFQLGLTN